MIKPRQVQPQIQGAKQKVRVVASIFLVFGTTWTGIEPTTSQFQGSPSTIELVSECTLGSPVGWRKGTNGKPPPTSEQVLRELLQVIRGGVASEACSVHSKGDYGRTTTWC